MFNHFKRSLSGFNIVLKDVAPLYSFNSTTPFRDFFFQKYCKVHIMKKNNYLGKSPRNFANMIQSIL